MRHQAHHIALAIADAGNGLKRTIWIRLAVVFSGIVPVGSDVTKNNLVVAFQLGERGRLAKIISFVVRNGHFQHLSGMRRASERRVSGFHADMNLAAEEPQTLVAHHRAGQQPRFEQYLKSVADSQHQAAGASEPIHRFHHRRKARNRAGAQIIAEGKSAGKNDRVEDRKSFRIGAR